MRKTECPELVRHLGNRIRLLRKAKNLSQEQFAELASLHPTYMGDIERGQVNASLCCYAGIAKALNISLSELVEFPADMKDMKVQDEMMVIYEKVGNLDKKMQTFFFDAVKNLVKSIESV